MMSFCLFSLKNANAEVVGSSESEEGRSNKMLNDIYFSYRSPILGNKAPHLEIAYPFFQFFHSAELSGVSN